MIRSLKSAAPVLAMLALPLAGAAEILVTGFPPPGMQLDGIGFSSKGLDGFAERALSFRDDAGKRVAAMAGLFLEVPDGGARVYVGLAAFRIDEGDAALASLVLEDVRIGARPGAGLHRSFGLPDSREPVAVIDRVSLRNGPQTEIRIDNFRINPRISALAGVTVEAELIVGADGTGHAGLTMWSDRELLVEASLSLERGLAGELKLTGSRMDLLAEIARFVPGSLAGAIADAARQASLAGASAEHQFTRELHAVQLPAIPSIRFSDSS